MISDLTGPLWRRWTARATRRRQEPKSVAAKAPRDESAPQGWRRDGFGRQPRRHNGFWADNWQTRWARPIDGGHKVPLGGHLHRPRPEGFLQLIRPSSPLTLLVHFLAKPNGSRWSESSRLGQGIEGSRRAIGARRAAVGKRGRHKCTAWGWGKKTKSFTKKGTTR